MDENKDKEKGKLGQNNVSIRVSFTLIKKIVFKRVNKTRLETFHPVTHLGFPESRPNIDKKVEYIPKTDRSILTVKEGEGKKKLSENRRRRHRSLKHIASIECIRSILRRKKNCTI